MIPYVRNSALNTCFHRRSQLGSSQEAEQHAISATSHTLSSLNEVDPEADWKMGAFVRAIDACRVPALRGSSCCSNIPGRDGSCILYVKLTLSGSRGAVAVGNSYAVVPSIIKAEEQAGEQSSLGARHTTAFLLTGIHNHSVGLLRSSTARSLLQS